MHPRILIVGNFLSTKVGMYFVSEMLYQRLSSQGWDVYRTSTYSNRFRRLFDMIYTVIAYRGKYDVAQVDVYSGLSFIWAEIVTYLLRILNKPIILTLHGGKLPLFASRYPIRVRRVLNLANVVTTPSRYLLTEMQPYRSDMRLIPNPIDLGIYPYRERVDPTPSIAWLRAFHTIYNAPMAIKTIALLKEEFPHIHLTMYGPDKEDGSLELSQSSVIELDLENHITIYGPVAKLEVPQYLNQHDIFLNSTNVDNTPVSVMEAMALGMCVVSTDVGGIPYLVEDGHNALLVLPDEPGTMASAVRRILTEPDLAGMLSRNARTASLAWDWDAVSPQWEQLFHEIAKGVEHGIQG